MPKFVRTSSEHPDFVDLVKALDAELRQRDGDENIYYNQFNKIDSIGHAVVAYFDDQPVGCGGMKEHLPGEFEIKRMYVLPEFRGKQIASQVLAELENWARELGYATCVLETGKRQPEAIRVYQKNGYIQIPNYAPYVGIENSLCFRKGLTR